MNVPNALGENSDMALLIQFMKSGDSKKFVDFVFKKVWSVIIDFTFHDAMDVKDILTFECYQLEGFPSHDTKHGWLVGGISTTANVWPPIPIELPLPSVSNRAAPRTTKQLSGFVGNRPAFLSISETVSRQLEIPSKRLEPMGLCDSLTRQ
jgi:hypothetical protein